MTDRFGFSVRQNHADWTDEYRAEFEAFVDARPGGYNGVWSDPDCPMRPLIDSWTVALPHQCDAWEITQYTWTEDHELVGPTQQRAIAQLEAFIAEAQEALAALKQGREYPSADD